MKKIKTTDIIAGSAMPLKSGSLDHLQSAYQETTIDTIQMLISQGDTEAYPTTLLPRIMYGCRWLSGIGAVSQGCIIYGNELYRTDGATGIVLGFGDVVVGTITTTYFTATNADPVVFSDATSNNVHEIKKITWAAGAPGSGDFDLQDCYMYNDWAEIVSYNGSYLSSSAGTLTLPGGISDFDLSFRQNGRTIIIDFKITAMTLAGANATYLQLNVPLNTDFKRENHAMIALVDSNDTPISQIGLMYTVAGTNAIRLQKTTGQWLIGTGLEVRGQITCELERADS
jgi:hypothetical protein